MKSIQVFEGDGFPYTKPCTKNGSSNFAIVYYEHLANEYFAKWGAGAEICQGGYWMDRQESNYLTIQDAHLLKDLIDRQIASGKNPWKNVQVRLL